MPTNKPINRLYFTSKKLADMNHRNIDYFQNPLPLCGKEIRHHDFPRRARDPPRDRGRMGQRRRRYPQLLLRLHDPKLTRKAYQLRVYCYDSG